MNSRKDVEILEQTPCHEGFFRLNRYRLRHRLFGGGWSPPITRELFERGHAAALLLYDPWRDQVVLQEQFRIGALDAPGGPWLLEVVAGVIDEGERPDEVVRREAVEEAGCVVDEVFPICDYLVSPGGTTEQIHLFYALIDSRGLGGLHGLAEEGEDIRVQVVRFETVRHWLESGRIKAASALIALQWLLLNRDRLRAQAWGHPPPG